MTGGGGGWCWGNDRPDASQPLAGVCRSAPGGWLRGAASGAAMWHAPTRLPLAPRSTCPGKWGMELLKLHGRGKGGRLLCNSRLAHTETCARARRLHVRALESRAEKLVRTKEKTTKNERRQLTVVYSNSIRVCCPPPPAKAIMISLHLLAGNRCLRAGRGEC